MRQAQIAFIKSHLKELEHFKEMVVQNHFFPSRETIILNIEKTEEHLITLLRVSGIDYH